MAWTGSGTYVLNPTYSPEVTGTTIDANRYNGLTSDIAVGITAALAKNGENVPTANLPMGGFRHTGANSAVTAGQYLTYGQTGAALTDLTLATLTVTNVTWSGFGAAVAAYLPSYLVSPAPIGTTTPNSIKGTTGTFTSGVSGTTGTFTDAVSGTTGTFSGALSATTGTFSGSSLAVGLSPSAWAGSPKFAQVGVVGISELNGNIAAFSNNWYSTSVLAGKYINAGAAGRYHITASGEHVFSYAPSGAANAVTSFVEAMRITNAGNITANLGTGTGFTADIVNSTSQLGYAVGLGGTGGTVTQVTSRSTAVTINKICGAITMLTAAGSAAWQRFQVNNSTVGATDTVIANIGAGATNDYIVTAARVTAGSFFIYFVSTGGVVSDTPVINFAVIKAVTA